MHAWGIVMHVVNVHYVLECSHAGVCHQGEVIRDLLSIVISLLKVLLTAYCSLLVSVWELAVQVLLYCSYALT